MASGFGDEFLGRPFGGGDVEASFDEFAGDIGQLGEERFNLTGVRESAGSQLL